MPHGHMRALRRAALALLLALAVHAEVGVRCAELGVGRARPRVRGAEC